ncbi:DNA-directed RNA polymerase subunit K [Candidatus Woesearchaeota archaeon]|nr:DNA-directed RNA polymerase subunit K [Candidatus Woesearchaeota archaeon]
MQKYSKYEKARILGSRALQLAMGAPMLLKFSKEDLEKIRYNPIEIAKRELDAGVLPIEIKRSTSYK